MLTSIELFYLCSFFFSKVTPTNSVLSFFDTGSRKGIIGNLWVLLKLTCSLNQCGRGSSQFLGRHRWVSFFFFVGFRLCFERFLLGTSVLPSPQNQHSKFQFVVESVVSWAGLLGGDCISVLGTFKCHLR